ncbi:DUF6264 family protein [Microbacterium sp. ZW T5_56]|uniref:DUF6264 family protein n=1 Tax=Microbacterium sp. ZW T5_56 TaxID=3378081 RepID=UPI00385201D9
MTESESRPRPQYGEYATPEEQRAHIREPLPTTAHPDPAEFSWPEAPTAAAVAPAPVAPAVEPRVAPTDRLITIVMLALGAMHVLLSTTSLLSYSSVMTEALMIMGLTREQADVSRTDAPGYVMAAILVVGFAVTVWLALRRLRGQKRSWWVPLAGWAVTWVVVIVVQTIVLAGDPAFQTYLEMAMRGASTPTP